MLRETAHPLADHAPATHMAFGADRPAQSMPILD
jgi:hypothetical protein